MRRWTVGLAIASVALVGLGGSYMASVGAQEAAPLGGPPVMRRLTAEQYRNSVQDIFGNVTLGGRFEPDQRVENLIAVGAGRATVTPGGLEEYDRMAMGIAGQVVDPQRRDQLIPCKPASATEADEACARAFLSKVGYLLFRRPLTDQEISGFVGIADAGVKETKDFYFGIQLALGAMLESPQFLFVHETREADPAGGYRLEPYSMATRLSLLLWGSTPDSQLLKAAENGELNNPKGLAAQVDRMLASPRVESGVRAFFSDMLEFDIFETLGKDGQLYPNYGSEVAKQAQEQTLRTLVDHLITRDGDYRDLFTTKKTYMTPLLASVYGLPYEGRWGRSWEWTEYEIPADVPSAGILTQISFVALHSHPGKTSPTLRGMALREVLLCQLIPPPPPNVDFSQFEAADGTKSLRQAIEAHAANPACASCHRMMDPIGLALENYDTIGSFRRTNPDGTPIDASGELDGVKYADAHGLGQAMHDSQRPISCLARRVYSYATGREPTSSERTWLTQSLTAQFAEDGYRFRQLLRRVALDPGFYRIQDQTPARSAT